MSEHNRKAWTTLMSIESLNVQDAELGFQHLEDPDNPHRVFIPMADVRATLG